MSDEETRRTMQFILNQQAQFAANQQRAGERISRLEDVVSRLATATLSRFESTDARARLFRKMLTQNLLPLLTRSDGLIKI